MKTLPFHAETLRSLHQGPIPLLLPNAWDAASARLVAGAGFPVIATSSGAIAEALGYTDDDSMPVDDAFAAVARIARAVDVPVTADLEAGYRLPAAEVVSRLLEAGAVGCNLEDTDHHGDGVLIDASEHAARIAAVKEAARAAGVDIVVNARVDVFLRYRDDPPRAHLDEAIRRARQYLRAGADCVYPITLADEDAIGEFVHTVAHPVNIYLHPKAPPITRLAELGVARISLGGGLMRTAYRTVREELARLRSESIE